MKHLSFLQFLFLSLIVGCFFVSSSLLVVAHLEHPANVHAHFDWPDEMMNAFFAERFAATGTFLAPTIAAGEDFVRPRSFNVVGGMLAPGGFLGMPLWYGAIARLVGVNATLFVTPLLGALTLLVVYSLLRSFVNTETGLLGAFLTAIHPAWWYYSAYSYLPNVPFVALCLCALWFAVRVTKRRRLMDAVFCGLCFSIALSIRTNEVLWLFVLVAAFGYAGRIVQSPKSIVAAVVSVCLFFIPVLWFQQQTFGSAFVTGYSRFVGVGAGARPVVAAPSEFETFSEDPIGIAIRAMTFPYGIHPRAVWYNLSRSWVWLAPWISLPLLGTTVWYIISFWRHQNRQRRVVLVAALVAAGLLVVGYGSWMLEDALVLRLNTIGISHVRYWLPLIFFFTPALAIFLGRMWQKGTGQRLAIVAYCGISLCLSARMVFFSEAESVLAVADRLRAYDKAASRIVSLTPTDAVIVTDRTDKEIFPDRAVTPGLPTAKEGTAAALQPFVASRQLYAYLPNEKSRVIDLQTVLSLPSQMGDPLFSFVVEPRPGFGLFRLSQ
jgi:hypothetical protein